MKAKQIQLRLMTRCGDLVVTAYELHEVFAAHRGDGWNDWTVTHRPSGYRVCNVRTFTQAKWVVKALLNQVPVECWQFTDPETVRGPAFRGCKAIVRKANARS